MNDNDLVKRKDALGSINGVATGGMNGGMITKALCFASVKSKTITPSIEAVPLEPLAAMLSLVVADNISCSYCKNILERCEPSEMMGYSCGSAEYWENFLRAWMKKMQEGGAEKNDKVV
ncbi:MAG: hypothetical protein IJ153_11060 [Clostridia bacterium]|nr:hypothetical protein [Clostridia bacterium]MBQ9212226.1 hypothetical protein [Clostridia bacterium]